MNVEKIYIVIGRNIRKARIVMGMTQGTLSIKTGLSRASVANTELGRQRVSLHHLVVFAKALKTTTEKLLKGAVL